MTLQEHSALFDYLVRAAVNETVSGFVKVRLLITRSS